MENDTLRHEFVVNFEKFAQELQEKASGYVKDLFSTHATESGHWLSEVMKNQAEQLRVMVREKILTDEEQIKEVIICKTLQICKKEILQDVEKQLLHQKSILDAQLLSKLAEVMRFCQQNANQNSETKLRVGVLEKGVV